MIDADSLRDHLASMWSDFNGSQLAQVNLLWWWHLAGGWVLVVPSTSVPPQPNTGPTRVPADADGVGRVLLCEIHMVGNDSGTPDGLICHVIVGGFDDAGAPMLTCAMWNPLTLEWFPTGNEGNTLTAMRMREMLASIAGQRDSGAAAPGGV